MEFAEDVVADVEGAVAEREKCAHITHIGWVRGGRQAYKEEQLAL